MTAPEPVPLAPRPPGTGTGTGTRVAAAIGGVIALGLAALVTAGIALVAPIGMAIARFIVRSRGRRPTLASSWLGAVTATAVLLALGLALVLARQPDLSKTMQRTVDSAMTASAERTGQPMPLSPGAVRALAVYGSTAGGIIGVVIVGALFGTVGWAASLPLAFAITGRWREPEVVEPLAPDA